jgi:hypothetical protein
MRPIARTNADTEVCGIWRVGGGTGLSRQLTPRERISNLYFCRDEKSIGVRCAQRGTRGLTRPLARHHIDILCHWHDLPTGRTTASNLLNRAEKTLVLLLAIADVLLPIHCFL